MVSEPPKFSVIVPTYHRPDRVAACLAAIAESRYPPEQFEVIIVDDGGALNAAPLEALCPQISTRVISQVHLGPAAARNKGSAAARGKFLAFTDDDCLPHPDWLHQLAAQLYKTPQCLVGGRTLNALTHNLYATASQDLISYLYTHFNDRPRGARFFTSNNMAVAADMFRSLGGFDRFFPFAAAEDRDFCDRWLHAGNAMVYVPEAVIYHAHNLSLGNFARQHFNYGRGAYRFHCKRAARTHEQLKLEPPSFYFRLVTYPLAQRYGLLKGLIMMLLMTAAQAANAAGYFREQWVDKA